MFINYSSFLMKKYLLIKWNLCNSTDLLISNLKSINDLIMHEIKIEIMIY